MSYCNYIIAVEFIGEIIPYDLYLTLRKTTYDPDRLVYEIETYNDYCHLSIDDQKEIISNLYPALKRKVGFPVGYSYRTSHLGDYYDEYGCEPRIWDILMGHI